MTSVGSSCWVSCVENRCNRENEMVSVQFGAAVRFIDTPSLYQSKNVCVLWCQHATVISMYFYSVNKMYEIKMKREMDILMFC